MLQNGKSKLIYCSECLMHHAVEYWQGNKPIFHCEQPIHPLLEPVSEESEKPLTATQSSGSFAMTPAVILPPIPPKPSPQRRYVVFRSKPPGVKSSCKQIAPLVSSFSPRRDIQQASYVKKEYRPRRLSEFQQPECTLEDNRCLGVQCWSFMGVDTDDQGHTKRRLYYG